MVKVSANAKKKKKKGKWEFRFTLEKVLEDKKHFSLKENICRPSFLWIWSESHHEALGQLSDWAQWVWPPLFDWTLFLPLSKLGAWNIIVLEVSFKLLPRLVMACPKAVKQLSSKYFLAQFSSSEPWRDWPYLDVEETWQGAAFTRISCFRDNVLSCSLQKNMSFSITVLLKNKFSKIAKEKCNHNYLHINFPVNSVKQRWIVRTLVCLNFNFCPDFKPIKLKFWFGQFTEKISGSLAWFSSLRFMFLWQNRNECFLAF